MADSERQKGKPEEVFNFIITRNVAVSISREEGEN